MKKNFVIKLSLLSIIIFSISLLLSHAFHLKVEEKNIFTSQYNEFFSQNNEIEFLIMGDSHAWEGIDPRFLPEDSYNFATGGENYIESYYKLRYLINNGKKIKYIIAPIDPHSFSSIHARSIDYNYFWNKFIDYPELLVETRDAGLLKNYIYGLLFSYSERDTIFRIISGASYTNEFYLGHRITTGTLDISTLSDTFIEKRADAFFDKKYNENIQDPLLFIYLGKFISLAKENDIQLVFVGYPHLEAYLEHIESRIDINELYRRIIQELKAADYDENILILNYLKQYSSKVEYFRDLDHLNQQGAEDFTKLILKDIQDKNSKINYNTDYYE